MPPDLRAPVQHGATAHMRDGPGVYGGSGVSPLVADCLGPVEKPVPYKLVTCVTGVVAMIYEHLRSRTERPSVVLRVLGENMPFTGPVPNRADLGMIIRLLCETRRRNRLGKRLLEQEVLGQSDGKLPQIQSDRSHKNFKQMPGAQPTRTGELPMVDMRAHPENRLPRERNGTLKVCQELIRTPSENPPSGAGTSRLEGLRWRS